MESDPNLPHVEYEDIVPGQGALNKNLAEKRSDKTGILFEPGDVLYGKLRPYLMNWLYPQFKGIAVGDFWVLRPLDIDGSFLYRLIQNPDFQSVANVSAGSKMPRADWKLVSQREFAIPEDLAEQLKVGALFSRLDSLITLHQRKQGNVWHRNGAWNGLTNSLVFRTPLSAVSILYTHGGQDGHCGQSGQGGRASCPDGADLRLSHGHVSAAEPSERPFALRGMPRALGVTDLSRDAMPWRLNVRVSDGELEALDRASAGMGCSRSQVVRLLIHCLADGGTRMGAGTVAFDYETSHGIVRNLRSIGTLYNQTVTTLNTIAKVARESPDEVTAEDALEGLRVVDAEMTYVANSPAE